MFIRSNNRRFYVLLNSFSNGDGFFPKYIRGKFSALTKIKINLDNNNLGYII